MKATNTHNEIFAHYFKVEHEGKDYEVTVCIDENGKFADDHIALNGEELEYEGTEGQIREDIIDYLAFKWDDLVK